MIQDLLPPAKLDDPKLGRFEKARGSSKKYSSGSHPSSCHSYQAPIGIPVLFGPSHKVLGQAQALLAFNWNGSIFAHLATIFGLALGLLLIAQILRSPRSPAASIGWILAIILIPFLGIPLFLFLGTRKLKKIQATKTVLHLPQWKKAHIKDQAIHNLLQSLHVPFATSGNTVSIHKNGKEALSDLLGILQQAKESIDLEVFILGNDGTGKKILEILTKKAEHGIRVRLLLDSVGSFLFDKNALKKLEASGGKVAWFIPVFHRPFKGRANLRNHRKVLIVDGLLAWTGGRNLADEYFMGAKGEESWVDFSFSLQGQSVLIYQSIFDSDWSFATETTPSHTKTQTRNPGTGESLVQVLASGPDVPEDPLYEALLLSCFDAKKRILIVTPYFVPDETFFQALKLASLRGVSVDLVMPKNSNHRIADVARERFLRSLAGVGAKIRLLPDRMIHAKAIVIDDRYALSGSANLDIRSLFLNFEAMSIFYSKKDVLKIQSWIEGIWEKGQPFQAVKANAFQEMKEGLVLLMAYQL